MIDRGAAVGEAPLSRAAILEAQLGASVEGSVVVSCDGRILSWNGRFLEIWKVGPEVVETGSDEVLQRALEPLLVDPRRYRDRLAHLYDHPDELGRDEIRLRDGRVLDRHTAPLTGEDGGEIAGRIWFFRDVTEEKRGEEGNRLLAAVADLLSEHPGDEALPQRIASLLVPSFSDWAAVDVLGYDEAFHRLGTAHVDPAKEPLLRELDRRYPVQSGQGHLRGRAVATGRPVVIEGADADAIRAVARDAEHAELLLALGLTSALWVPLVGRSETLGVMSFGLATDRRSFGPEGLALATELARRCALVIDNARIYDRLRRREQQQAVVAGLGLRALGGAGLDDLLDEAVRKLAATLDVEFAKILEQLPDKRRLRLRAGVGWRPGIVGEATLGTDRGSQAGYTLRSGSPVVVTDLATESRFTGAALLLDHGVVSGMSVIIEGHGVHWGVLGAHTARRRRFTEDDIHFLQAVANVLADAIERQRGEDEIRERDDRLELTLAASRTGFWEWDVAGGRLEWSDQVSAMHGLPPGNAPTGFDQYVNEIIHSDDRERFLSTVTAAVEAGSQYDLEYRILWPDGSVHWTNGVGRAFVDAAGIPIRMIGIGRDITDRKREEEEREASIERERAAGQIREAFIGVLSHELRTPITTIYGGVKVLRRRGESLDPGSRAAVLDDIDSEADRLFRLVEDLLVLTRAERGNLDVGDEPVHLPPIVDRVLATSRATWPEIGFECNWAGRLPVVRGDDTYVEQVLRNLVGNAGKYSSPATMVEIETKVVDHSVEVRVLDRGPGIDEANAERLFDLFYRASATARAASGAGIGLFVARRLVEAMNGRMWAQPRPGGGSEFGFSLNLYDDK